MEKKELEALQQPEMTTEAEEVQENSVVTEHPEEVAVEATTEPEIPKEIPEVPVETYPNPFEPDTVPEKTDSPQTNGPEIPYVQPMPQNGQNVPHGAYRQAMPYPQNVPYGQYAPYGQYNPQVVQNQPRQPQNVPPYGYDAYGRPVTMPPYGYAPQGNGGGVVPPQNPAGWQVPEKKPKGNGGKVVLWILAVLLELIIAMFAVIGIYAVATGALRQDVQRPATSVPEQRPQERAGTTSSKIVNTSDVQMGIVCAQMPEQMAEYFKIERGLVVQSINESSDARHTELQEGDIITHANGVRVMLLQDLYAVMEKMKPGDVMKLTVYRVSENNEVSSPFDVMFEVQERDESAYSSQAPKSQAPQSKYPSA